MIAAMVHKYVVAQERREPEVVLWGSGEPSREFLYVEDAARALILAPEHADSFGASVFVLMPKRDLVFAEAGADVLEGLYVVHRDLCEVFRRLAYNLDHAWRANDGAIVALTRVYSLATGALVVEILSLAVLLVGNIV